ncbi:MAG: hypothetical protein KGJ53_12415 [Alphaproteobacteria bacterium]|nr:hypothetical protein [Alphaproteobacteria bacterium]
MATNGPDYKNQADELRDVLKDKAFDVEHALDLYAKSFVTLPAFAIYEDACVAPLLPQIADCHIYLIGLTPKIDVVGVELRNNELIAKFLILGTTYELNWKVPIGTILCGDGDTGWHVQLPNGERYVPNEKNISDRLVQEHNAVDFKVVYIGQAFGADGSRNALDRLKKHETLQKIAVKGIPDGYRLTILMLAIEPGNTLITLFNPFAKDNLHGDERIGNGLDKLFGTNEAERTTLYEASLIRYFQPPYNKEFRDSFPSTNMKLLADCYKKDFSAIIAEICIDELPFVLFSDVVGHKIYHVAKHDLHTDDARNMFFSMGK